MSHTMRVRFFFRNFAASTLAAMLLLPIVSTAQQPKKESLLNGLKVLMFPNTASDKVVVRIRVHSGAAFDPQGKEGLMQMLVSSFFPTEAAREYFKDDLGGSLDITANYDYIEVDASAKPDSLIPMLETLSGGIVNTVIDKETTQTLRAAQLAKVKQLGSDPDYVADRAAAARLFGAFPYGRPQLGTEDSIKKIDFADLLDARQRFLTADNATMTLSGSFETNRALQAVKRYFGGWTRADKKIPATFRQPEDPPVAVFTVASPAADRFAVRVALRGTSRGAADMPAAAVYARILEARLRARLPAAVSALVSARDETRLLPGSIVIAFSGPQNTTGNRNGKVQLDELLPKVLNDPITDAEFGAARDAAAAVWNKRSPEDLWLDRDTYSLPDQANDRVFDGLTIAKVRDFAASAARQPMATVVVSSPK
jgi:hypothetical protein